MSTLKCLGLAFLCAGWVAVRAQETLSSVQRDLDRVEKEIDREKELHKQERKRATEFEAQKAEKLQALQEQARLTQARIDSLKREVEKARHVKTAHKAQAQFFAGKEKDFRKALAASLRRLAEDLRQDFPHQREKRVADCEELAKAVEAGTSTAEESLNRLTNLLTASLDFASGVEIYSGVYSAVSGGNHEGTYLRLGAAYLAFISEDGKLGALLIPGAKGYRWMDSDLPVASRDALAAAVRVAQGKESPRLVALPVSVGELSPVAPASAPETAPAPVTKEKAEVKP